MAELEQEVDVDTDIDLDVDTETTDDSEQDNQTDDSEITYEQAMDWKKKAERLEKAEKKLVELKKQAKDKPKTDDTEVYTKQDAMLDKFIAKNPNLEGYEADLKEYLKKGNTLEEARVLVENKDKTIQNRAKTNTLNITASEGTPKTTFTKADLENMDKTKYAKTMELIESGKAILKR